MIPQTIRNNTASGTLALTWADGRVQTLSPGALRAACPCAFCRVGRQRGPGIAVEEKRRITALHSRGYGLQIAFNDGHDRGIYPWAYLLVLT